MIARAAGRFDQESPSSFTFSTQHDWADLHLPVHGLAHVVDRQQGDADGREGFHFDARAAGT